jgi:hypothetical protein
MLTHAHRRRPALRNKATAESAAAATRVAEAATTAASATAAATLGKCGLRNDQEYSQCSKDFLHCASAQ